MLIAFAPITGHASHYNILKQTQLVLVTRKDFMSNLQGRGWNYYIVELGSDAGFRIITISGTNTGATMKADRLQHGVMQANEIIYDGGEDENCLDAYANNNYQAVNNSVLVGGSYSADDPGVHVEMVNEKVGDDVDGEEEEEEKTETERKIKV